MVNHNNTILMMVYFRCLVACRQSVVLGPQVYMTHLANIRVVRDADAKAEKEKILFFFHAVVPIFFGADSNVKLAENPFININLGCMAAILDPERASERVEDAQWTRLSAKCTGKKEGTFYITIHAVECV